MSSAPTVAAAIEGGELTVGTGLLSLIRPALDRLPPGGVLAVLSRAASVRDDLPAWCRLERHVYLERRQGPDGIDRHLIERGRYAVARGAREHGIALPVREVPIRRGGERVMREGMLSADMLAAVPMPAAADPSTGFAPRGAIVEPGGPAYPFTLCDSAHIAAKEVAQIYDQATAQQWDAQTTIQWAKIKPLPAPLEAAIGQIMTFLAENELSALYVPARFLPRIHPAYAEVAMVIAQQLADEARHIDVFLKRARAAGGGLGMSTVTTSRSLFSLLQPEDFTEAAFLLSVLGEGTFIDLLRFIEDHAPDEPTADLALRARQDETRHVHFGMSHVRHALTTDPNLFHQLELATHRRAEALAGIRSVPPPVQDALVVLAARGTAPQDIARGHDAFQELLETMAKNRVSRLMSVGFTADQAAILSGLHTSNFM